MTKFFNSCSWLIFIITYLKMDPTSANNKMYQKDHSNSSNTKGPPVVSNEFGARIKFKNARDNIDVKCPLICDPSCMFQWQKDGKEIIEDGRIHILGKSKEQVHIRSLKHKDAGLYECHGINGFGSRTVDVHLFVNGDDAIQNNMLKPGLQKVITNGTSPQILIDNLPQERVLNIIKGNDLVLKCEATGIPNANISWYKNNNYLLKSKTNISTLRIQNVAQNDTGKYKCEARNLFGISVYEVDVQITGSWHQTVEILSLSPSNLTLERGGKGKFTCIVRSENVYNKPSLYWVKRLNFAPESDSVSFFHNGEPFQLLNRTKIIEEGDGIYSSTLVFSNVSRAMAGTYYCIIPGYVQLEYSSALLLVRPEKKSNEYYKQRGIAVQWAIVWVVGFSFVAVTVAFLILRIYGCHCKRKPTRAHPHSVTPTRMLKSPGESGETLSTTLTIQKEVLQPFLNSGGYCLSQHSSGCPTFVSYYAYKCDQKKGSSPSKRSKKSRHETGMSYCSSGSSYSCYSQCNSSSYDYFDSKLYPSTCNLEKYNVYESVTPKYYCPNHLIHNPSKTHKSIRDTHKLYTTTPM